MKLLSIGSLSGRLAALVVLSIIPALVILLYSGLEQRRLSIESAQKQMFQQTITMGHLWEDMTVSAQTILSTLALMPDVKAKDTEICNEILKVALKENPKYKNFALTDLNGVVIASGKKFKNTNMADRKDFRQVLKSKDFAVGEYTIPRIGFTDPVFTFASPVFDPNGTLTAVLSTALELDDLSPIHDTLNLPERSFISITDHQGIRLYYHPAQSSTNPVGKPINAQSWQVARDAKGSGTFTGTGSDGHKRILSYEPIRLRPEEAPYLYVWAGIPEAHIVDPANAKLIRNLLLMLIVTIISVIIAWVIGRHTEALITKLEAAAEEIQTLRGIIPICSYCKNIRNDDGYYERIEVYIQKHSGADFSHTICPACMKKHFPEYQEEDSET